MAHFSYSKFALEARKARAKLIDQIYPWEWYNSDPKEGSSPSQKIIAEMNAILRTVDPDMKHEIIDDIEDLDMENKLKLGELLGIKYEPVIVNDDQW